MTSELDNKIKSSHLAEIMMTRRSVGAFTTQPVDPAFVASLLDVAVYAPNHRLTEPWRFVLLVGTGKEKYAEIRREMTIASIQGNEADKQLAGDGAYKKFASVPAFLVVAMRQHDNAEIREEDYAACSAMIQNFMLLAWDQGLGSSWKTFKDSPSMRALLSLAADEKVVGVIHLGYPAEQTAGKRLPAGDRLTVIS